MSIDLTTLITNLQADVDAVDSSTSMSSILSLMHKARKITSISNYYDSAGLLPVDSSYDGMLAFSKADNTMYKFVDSGINAGTVQAWHKADSAFSSPSGPTPYGGGSVAGYSFGGSGGSVAHFDKIAFSNDAITNISPALPSPTNRQNATGGRSSTYGYIMGGLIMPAASYTNQVAKFPFTSPEAVSVLTGTLYDQKHNAHSEFIGPSDHDYTYMAGGVIGPPGFHNNVIQKFATASDTDNGTDVGDLLQAISRHAGHTSGTHGYTSAGYPIGTPNDMIQKWPFASDGNSTDVGDRTIGVNLDNTGASSSTHGYGMGGNLGPPGKTNVIDKWPFASDANATDVGDLAAANARGGGVSSTTDGYMMGGDTAPNTSVQKFSFSSDGNASAVATLTEGGGRQGTTEN